MCVSKRTQTNTNERVHERRSRTKTNTNPWIFLHKWSIFVEILDFSVRERTVSPAARIDIEIFGLGSTSKSCNSLWSEVPRHLLTEKGILLMWDNACPSRSAAATCPSSERGTMTSATPQINFPYMSDACTPAMDVQMAAQGEGMPRSFWPSLSVLLTGDDG